MELFILYTVDKQNGMLLFQLFACYTGMSDLKQRYPELKEDRETPARLNKTRLENIRSRLHHLLYRKRMERRKTRGIS